MRPLPRIFAVTDDSICRREDFGIRAAAIAAGGAAVGIVVRAPEAPAAERLRLTDRVTALARPPEAAVIAHGDAAVARAAGASGVQLRRSDLAPADARRVLGSGWIGVAVHQPDEARAALAEGVDFLVAGNVYDTPSHPGRPGRGPDWLARIARLGVPVVAIGGITAARIPELLAAGAWGVAAISALWHAADPARATLEFLEALTP